MDTKGWDAVFVSSVGRVNAQLADHMSNLGMTFDFKKNNIEFSGTFGAWQVALHGSGKLLSFETPITKGTLTITNQQGGPGESYDLAGVCPLMQLQLSFIDNVTLPNVKDLKFNCTVQGTGPGDTTPGAVTVLNPDTTGKISSSDADTSIAWGLLNEYLPQIFIANQAQLAYAFARVSMVPQGSAGWLAPQRFDYLYIDPTTGQTGFLAILAVTTDRDVSGLPLAIDGSLLDTTDDVFTVISEGLFLENVVLPMLPSAYGHGATAANFAYRAQTPTSGQIVNQGDISCGSVKKGAIDYYPKIEALTISVSDDSMVSDVSKGSFDITGLANAYVTFSLTTTNKLSYDPNTNAISFLPDPNPKSDPHKHIPWYDYAAAALGGGIIIAVVDLVISLVTSSLASSVSGSVGAGGRNSLASASAAAVSWNGLQDLRISSVGLAQSFFVRGTYQ